MPGKKSANTDDSAEPRGRLAELGKSPAIDLVKKTGADLVHEGRGDLGSED